MTKLCTTLSLIALMSGAAFAQEATSPPAATPAPAERMAVPSAAAAATQISAKNLLNESVRNAANENVGDINDVIIGADGTIAAVIVGVGGFLGLGEKDVALPFSELTFATDSDNDLVVSTSATKESLQLAPEYKKPDRRS